MKYYVLILLVVTMHLPLSAQPLEKWLTIGSQEWLIPVDPVIRNPDTLTYEEELFKLLVPANASFGAIFTFMNECSLAYDSVANQLIYSWVIPSIDVSIQMSRNRQSNNYDSSLYIEPLIKRCTMDISDDIASRLAHLWRVAIQTAREPETRYQIIEGRMVYSEITDGNDYEFYAYGKRARSTLDGGKGRAKVFTDFAVKLSKAVQTGNRTLIKKINEDIDSICNLFVSE